MEPQLPFIDDDYENGVFERIVAANSSLTGRTFTSCSFTGCDFSGSDFLSSSFEDCSFTECNLTGAKFTDARMSKIAFRGSKIMGVDFTAANPFAMDISFDGCVIDSCDFCGMKLKKTPFMKCEITATDFIGTDLTGTDFSHTVFRDAGFDRTNLSGADFTEAHGYAINPVANNVRKAKFSLPDAVTLLEIMGIIIK